MSSMSGSSTTRSRTAAWRVTSASKPLAQALHVRQVVGGQHDGRPLPAVELGQEAADDLLAHHVEADGGFVEQDDGRIVQEGGGDVAPHTLAQGELAHRCAEQGAEVEQLDEGGQVLGMPAGRHPVDVTQEVEGVPQRKVPPELGALAEHHPQPARHFHAATAGIESGHRHPAGAGHEDPGEHLDGRGLAGTVGADVAHHRSSLDRK